MWIKYKSGKTCALVEMQGKLYVDWDEELYNVRLNNCGILWHVSLDVANFVVNKIFDELARGTIALDLEAVLAEYKSNQSA